MDCFVALGFGVGIAQGYATLGTIGFEGRYDYAAIGPVANLASRLCDEATNGEIFISQRALAAVEDLIEAEPVGDLVLLRGRSHRIEFCAWQNTENARGRDQWPN